MPNVSNPMGLVPVRTLHGAPWNQSLVRCFIPATDNNAMFIGDPVDLAGSADAGAVCPTVVRATAGAGNPVFGAIVAFEPDPNNLTLTYRPASTARYCWVVCDPLTVYEIQADGGAVLGPTEVGLNAVFIAGSGNTRTGLSGWQMDSGTTTAPAVNATYQLLILRAVNRPDNDITSVNAKWEVLISLHRLNPNYSNNAFFGIRGV